jgi:hypothetical protein
MAAAITCSESAMTLRLARVRIPTEGLEGPWMRKYFNRLFAGIEEGRK